MPAKAPLALLFTLLRAASASSPLIATQAKR